MQARSRTDRQRAGPTFIESVRRKQIVGAAVEVLARDGFAALTFSKIAKEAGLSSTGMVSYYFAGKDELLAEVVSAVLRRAEEYVGPRLEQAGTHRAVLRLYIELSVEFIAEHPKETAALVEVVTGVPTGPEAPGRKIAQGGVELLTGLLSEGQKAGEFGEFDPEVMAVAVRAAIDGTVRRVRIDPALDLAHYGQQLAALFSRATAAGAAHEDEQTDASAGRRR